MANTRNPNMQAKQRKERHAANMPKITRMYSQHGCIQTSHQKGGCNQTSKWPQRPTSNKSIKGKQARIWQWPRSKQTISTYSAYRHIDNMWPRFFIFPLQGSSYVFPSCDTKQWEWVLGRKCGGHEVNWRKKGGVGSDHQFYWKDD